MQVIDRILHMQDLGGSFEGGRSKGSDSLKFQGGQTRWTAVPVADNGQVSYSPPTVTRQNEARAMLDHLNAVFADRYLVERELGRGGMAAVWLARDVRHDRLVAIKVLHPELAGAIGVDRFIREIRLASRLQHPNVIPVFDSGTFAGPNGVTLPWYAMSYIDGESLRSRLDRERLLPIDDAVSIAEETAAALQAAHREGIVHRDIKPENILVAGGHTYVADFGIAKALIETGGERLTSTGLAIGTPAYMSPEQSTAEQVDARTDQYSLATVLYEMLTGETPFSGNSSQAIVGRRMVEPARAIRPVRSSVPESLEGAVLKALERIPADRFDDIATFAKALRDPSLTTRHSRRPQRRLLIGAVAGALLVIALPIGWLVSQRGGKTQAARDPRALALYQRGVTGYDRRTPAGINDAVQAFTAAVELDSTYSAAWAGLAKTYVRAYERRFRLPGVAGDSILRLAVAAVDRALAGDRNNADALVTRAVVIRQIDPTDRAPVIRTVLQALKIDSTNAPGWHVLAVALAESGDFIQAIDAWRHSVKADPSYTQGLAFLALAHYWKRQYDSAAYWADSAIAVDPNYLLGRSTAGHVAIERKNYGRARASFQAARRLSSDVEIVNSMFGSALVEARSGGEKDARAILAGMDSVVARYSPLPLHTVVYFAQARAAVGDTDEAIEWLKRYTPQDDLHFQLHLRCDPPFAPLDRDQRFQSLLLAPASDPSRDCRVR